MKTWIGLVLALGVVAGGVFGLQAWRRGGVWLRDATSGATGVEVHVSVQRRLQEGALMELSYRGGQLRAIGEAFAARVWRDTEHHVKAAAEGARQTVVDGVKGGLRDAVRDAASGNAGQPGPRGAGVPGAAGVVAPGAARLVGEDLGVDTGE